MELNRPPDRIISAEPGEDDLTHDLRQRPQHLNEFIGRHKAKEQLTIALNRNGTWCALAIVAAIFAIYPIANMGFLDDFSYTKTAYEFARTGHIVYNGWDSPMLGWQIPWGALFVKIFGYSFNVVRFSMLPIAMATVYLFHQILLRFGISSRNAVLGALTLGLSPLFLLLSSSFMSDIPGLFVILICIYMCQRAVSARTDRAALLWLIFAALTNVAGGTARQIAWLGALVMVPSTAWLLRRRRGMKIAGVLMWVFSLLGVLTCLHWFNSQPYSLPERIFERPIHARMLLHLGDQLLKAFMSVLRFSLPISIALLAVMGWRSREERLRSVNLIAALCLIVIALNWREYHQISWIGTGLTLLTLLPVAFLIVHAIRRMRSVPHDARTQLKCWAEFIAILGPFSLAYFFLLMPRGIYSDIFERYVLGLVPIAIIGFLKLYESYAKGKISALSVVFIVIMAAYAISTSHDFFSESRETVSAMQMLQHSGIARTSVQVNIPFIGPANNGWTQIEAGGHINDPRIRIPAGAYVPYTPDSELPADCIYRYAKYTPAIVPKYFIVSKPDSCFADTKYPAMRYRTWLPPFHRAMYIQKLKDQSR